MMNPVSMSEGDLMREFIREKNWFFIPFDQAEVCNLLRFKTMMHEV